MSHRELMYPFLLFIMGGFLSLLFFLGGVIWWSAYIGHFCVFLLLLVTSMNCEVCTVCLLLSSAQGVTAINLGLFSWWEVAMLQWAGLCIVLWLGSQACLQSSMQGCRE